MPVAVYQGPWINVHSHWFMAWVWTVSDNGSQGFAVIIGLFVLLAAERSWKLLRTTPFPGIHLVELRDDGVEPATYDNSRLPDDFPIELLENARLPDAIIDEIPQNEETRGAEDTDDQPDHPLPKVRSVNIRDIDFKPKDALYACFGWRTHKPRVKMLRDACKDSSFYLWILCFWALAIYIVCVCLAPFIPWLITARIETPIVVTKYTKGCGYSPILSLLELPNIRKAEQMYLQCDNSNPCGSQI